MTDTKDFRWKAADAVMRKSMAALQELLNQQNLIRTRNHGMTEQASDQPVDDALLLETQRAMDMASEALADVPNQEQ